MKTKLLALLIIVMVGCDQVEGDLDNVAFETADFEELAEVPPTEQPAYKTAAENSERKLIRRGDLQFETKDLQASLKLIKTQVQKTGGYISNDMASSGDDRLWNTLTARIPNASFDAFMAAISKDVAHFDTKEISINDVTEEYLDVQTRIKTKKKIEQRFLEILKSADTVEDILKVEAEAGKLRVEIERLEGRLKYLSNQTSMSTLNITCYQVLTVTTNPKNTFISKLQAGLWNGVDIVKAIVLGLVNIWPLLLIAIAGVFVYRSKLKPVKTTDTVSD